MHHNDPATIGWLLIAIVILAVAIYLTSLAQERVCNRRKRSRVRKNDNNIFKAAEEARRDFS